MTTNRTILVMLAAVLAATIASAQEGDRLWFRGGHEDSVRALAWGPHERYLASGDVAGTIVVWEADRSERRLVLRGHVGAVTCVVVSRDGRWIGSSGADGTVRLWELATGRQMWATTPNDPQPATRRIESIAFTPDSRHLVTVASSYDIYSNRFDYRLSLLSVPGGLGGPGGRSVPIEGHGQVSDVSVAEVVAIRSSTEVLLVDAGTGETLHRLDEHRGAVTSARFSHDGARIVTTATDSLAIAWEVATARRIATLTAHRSPVREAAFTHDDTFVLSAGDDGVLRRWRTTDWGAADSAWGHRSAFTAMALGDSMKVATADAEARIELWNAASPAFIWWISGHRGAVTGLAFTPDREWLVSSGSDGTVRYWRVTTGRMELTHYARASGIVSMGHDEALTVRYLVDARGMLVEQEIPDLLDRDSVATGHVGTAGPIAVSADGRLVATAGTDQTVRLFRTRPLESAGTLALGNSITSIAFSRDGLYLYAAQDYRQVTTPISVIETATMREVSPQSATVSRGMLAMSRDSVRLFVVGDEARAEAMQLDYWPPTLRYGLHSDSYAIPVGARALAVSDDRSRLVVAGDEGMLAVVDLLSNDIVQLYDGCGETITHVALSPSHEWIAIGTIDGSVGLYRARRLAPR